MQRQILLITIIIATIGCLSLFIRVGSFKGAENYYDYIPVYPAAEYPRPTLLQTDHDITDLLERRKELRSQHISGIILQTLPSNWYDQKTALNGSFSKCKKLNHIYKESYLLTKLIPPSLNDMPNWDDLENWTTLNYRLQDIARFAKKAGFTGLVIDTTVTNSAFWCPEENPRYKDISDEFASKIIYQRAREMIQHISKVSPTMPIILAPAGSITPKPKRAAYPHYQYWTHFANGLMSTRHPGGITLLATHYADITTTADFQEKLNSDLATLNVAFDEKHYWQNRGALSLIVSGVGVTENTLTKLKLAQKYSQKYVIITDEISPELVSPLYDTQLKGYYVSVTTKKNPLWVEYHFRRLIHTIKDHWHEII